MKIIKINLNNPDLTSLNEAIDVMEDEGVVLYPTDTIYGLGANIFSKKAINKVFTIKKRDKSKAISISVNNLDWISKLADINSETKNIISKFLPGPFTFLLNKNNNIFTNNNKNNINNNVNSNDVVTGSNVIDCSDDVTGSDVITSNLKIPVEILANSNKVGIRMPNNPIAIYLAKKFPITTTSANISNNDILSNPIEIANELNGNKYDNDSDLIDIVIDTGNISYNNPSTIVDLSNGIENSKIIRRGTGKFLL